MTNQQAPVQELHESKQIMDAVDPATGENSKVAAMLKEAQNLVCPMARYSFQYKVGKDGFVGKDPITQTDLSVEGSGVFAIDAVGRDTAYVDCQDGTGIGVVTQLRMLALSVDGAELPAGSKVHIQKLIHLISSLYIDGHTNKKHQQTVLAKQPQITQLPSLFSAVGDVVARAMFLGGLGEIFDTTLSGSHGTSQALATELKRLEAFITEDNDVPRAAEEVILTKQIFFASLTKLGFGQGMDDLNVMCAEIVGQLGEAVGVEVSGVAQESTTAEDVGFSPQDIYNEGNV